MCNVRFNSLIIIGEEFSKKQGFVSRRFVKVRCDCGLEFIACCSKLKNGTTKQCKNCSFKIRSQRKSVPQVEQIFRRLIIDRCAKNNLEIGIDCNDYIVIAAQKCHYCGDPPLESNRFKSRKYVNTESIAHHGVDRIDPKRGYHYNNLVPCCKSCNYAKHILTKEEFLNKIKKIYENHFKGEDLQSVMSAL